MKYIKWKDKNSLGDIIHHYVYETLSKGRRMICHHTRVLTYKPKLYGAKYKKISRKFFDSVYVLEHKEKKYERTWKRIYEAINKISEKEK